MKIAKLIPNGWPCTYGECPSGAFIHNQIHLGFKSEYKNEGFNEAGEYFCGGDDIIVQPVYLEWEEIE